ncbi:MAG TPA: hypothetical protein VLN58_02050 [Verrucomicrobiae bacterium]|nr:hypothetical protein [Verrucomicrobiae bacterium]
MSGVTRLTTRDSFVTFAEFLAERKAFRTGGSLYGTEWPAAGGTGELPDYWARKFNQTEKTYVVFSYATPIAWCDVNCVWTVPDVRYSVTTSKHQSRIRTAVSYLTA